MFPTTFRSLLDYANLGLSKGDLKESCFSFDLSSNYTKGLAFQGVTLINGGFKDLILGMIQCFYS